MRKHKVSYDRPSLEAALDLGEKMIQELGSFWDLRILVCSFCNSRGPTSFHIRITVENEFQARELTAIAPFIDVDADPTGRPFNFRGKGSPFVSIWMRGELRNLEIASASILWAADEAKKLERAKALPSLDVLPESERAALERRMDELEERKALLPPEERARSEAFADKAMADARAAREGGPRVER